MTRKEFISKIWKKGIIPIAFFISLLFATKFIYLTISNQGTERFISILLLSLIILFALSALVGEFAAELKKRVLRNIPAKLLVFLKLTVPFLKISVLGVTAWLVYITWTNDWIAFFIVVSILIVDNIVSRPRQPKQP